jgi:hypothetical protein
MMRMDIRPLQTEADYDWALAEIDVYLRRANTTSGLRRHGSGGIGETAPTPPAPAHSTPGARRPSRSHPPLKSARP